MLNEYDFSNGMKINKLTIDEAYKIAKKCFENQKINQYIYLLTPKLTLNYPFCIITKSKKFEKDNNYTYELIESFEKK